MSKRIIIAEDDPHIRIIYVNYLAKLGRLEVDAYENGEQVLERIKYEKKKGRTYDGAITGYLLKGRIDGLKLTGQLTKEFGIPVFMISGGDREILEPLALKAGAAGFIQKPFNLHDLDSIVESLNPAQQQSKPDYE